MLKCLILNDREPIPEGALDQFSNYLELYWHQAPGSKFSLDVALSECPGAQILITTYMDLSASNLGRLQGLKAIIATTTGVDYIDLAYCREKGIRVCNTRNYTGSSVAEHALMLMLAAARRIDLLDKRIRQGDFDCFDVRGIELTGKTAGVIGLGNIGSTIARLCLGLGMKILFSNRSQKMLEGARQVDLQELLSVSDVIFVSVPLNDESKGLIDSEALSLVKSSALLISTSPDTIIDKGALDSALRSGKLAAAALDLHARDKSYLDIPNLILTPRRAWFTEETFVRRIDAWKDVLASYLKDSPINVVA